jgi:hypothetical protein
MRVRTECCMGLIPTLPQTMDFVDGSDAVSRIHSHSSLPTSGRECLARLLQKQMMLLCDQRSKLGHWLARCEKGSLVLLLLQTADAAVWNHLASFRDHASMSLGQLGRDSSRISHVLHVISLLANAPHGEVNHRISNSTVQQSGVETNLHLAGLSSRYVSRNVSSYVCLLCLFISPDLDGNRGT